MSNASTAVRIVDVPQHHAILGFQFIERPLVGDVAAFAMSDREMEYLALLGRRGERRIGGLHAQRHVAADEFQAALRSSAPGSSPASTRI